MTCYHDGNYTQFVRRRDCFRGHVNAGPFTDHDSGTVSVGIARNLESVGTRKPWASLDIPLLYITDGLSSFSINRDTSKHFNYTV